MKFLTALLSLLLLSACADTLYPSYGSYMQAKKIESPSAKRFAHCQNYDCAVVKNIEPSKGFWKGIEKSYGKPASDARQEREKISKIIGLFERTVGPMTGTAEDKRGTFIETGDGQLDCVDESTNTTIFLTLLKQKGLIRFHTIGQPEVRWPIVSGRGWMHQTAVITDVKTGERYAADSWFEDNGADAWIVPLEEWRAGWHPSLITDGKGPRALDLGQTRALGMVKTEKSS